ncbi:hypothetical protein F5B18DRAFT_191601 [Nemania serpens]|nr:hypothetical protein F5B18DRAFT_191601 [Nemania serpens]
MALPFFHHWFLLHILGMYFAFYYVDLYGYRIPGRILSGFIAARYLGPLNTAVPTAASVAVVLYFWPVVVHAPGPLYAFSAVYGLVASALQSLFAVTLAALTTDLGRLGTKMAMVFSVVAFASLTGSPIAGAIVQASSGGYLDAQLWAASSMLLGAGALAAARVGRTGWVLWQKI